MLKLLLQNVKMFNSASLNVQSFNTIYITIIIFKTNNTL